ncbi:hypothetical protein SLA2020_452790 [Shorea laevis]
MAASRISSAKPQRTYWAFTTALASAVVEWLLILFLFVNATFSFLVTKFARCCKLQTPCLLCSRLDHVFGSEKLGYYWELICCNHKLEISSLVLCHAHNKLVDVHGMCETCFFSFATINNPMLKHTDYCEPWVLRSYTHKLIQTKSGGCEAAELDVPLSGEVELNEDDWKMRREKPSVSVSGLDSLAHVGYTELKATSDTESEVLYSDDDDASALLRATHVSKDDFAVQDVQLEPLIITLANDSVTEKLIIADSAPEVFFPVSQVQLDSIEVHGSRSVASTAAVKNGLEELNGQQPDSKANSPAPIEADSKVYSTAPIDLISLDYVTPSSNTMETSVEVSKESLDLTRTGEGEQTSVAECGKINDARTTPIMSSEIGLETEPVSSDTAQLVPNLLDLGDAYKIAVGSGGRQLSGLLVEQWVGKDNSRVSEDLKLLLSQLSATRGIEQSMNDKSPRVFVNGDESKASVLECGKINDARTTPIMSSEIGLETKPVSSDTAQLVPNLLDLGDAYKIAVGSRGRQLSGVLAEQWVGKDNSTVNEDVKLLLSQLSATRGIEQSMNDKSPRVSVNGDESKITDASSSIGIQMLQKRISLERNENESGLSLDGSIISEIEGESMAMAMITKLQEEKATLHMEALQCLRLMEEQSEYDMEALQKANDLLADREKEIQDLEDELEFYRKKFPNESILENVVEETCDVKARDIGMDRCESVCVEDSASVLRDSVTENLISVTKLKEQKLEKKLYSFSNNGEYLANVEEDDLSMQNDISVSRTNLHAQASFENSQPICKENMKFDGSGQGSLVLLRETDLASLGNEFSDLNGRLVVLEADQTFLEHAINSVGNGEEGLQLVREIASHLQELRRIGIRRIDPTIA